MTMDKSLQNKLSKIYRSLHQYPELGWQEYKTSRLIAQTLKNAGIKVKTGVGKTGVVSLLDTPGNKCLALRADMDALPIKEATNLLYASKNKGVMHACGHDGNMTTVLGAAMLLVRQRDRLKGQVKFIFQPNEENANGALAMIKDGVLENPPVTAIIGVHVSSAVPTGKIGIKYGQMMAAVDEFTITVLGEGGHGAYPHKGVDAIVVASQVIANLQTLVSRQIDPLAAVVISVGSIHGGNQFNILADKVVMNGTVRTLDEKLHKKIPQMMKRAIDGITKSMGAHYKLDYKIIGHSLVNDDKINDLIKKVAFAKLGQDNVVLMAKPSMGGEDFAAYLDKVPGAFIYLGTADKDKKQNYPWHHPKFRVNEKTIFLGAELLAGIAEEYLKS
ncbi:MAG: M20 family metallopeptidase [bacterium]